MATKHHARALARIMRRKDREEVMSSGGLPPEQAVRASINRSEESYAVYAGNDLLCVFGVTLLPPQGKAQLPWALGSDLIDKHRRVFWKCSKVVIEHFRDKYPLMFNMIHGQNTPALRWLERLGFTLSPPERWGKNGDLFCRAMLVTQKIEVIHV